MTILVSVTCSMSILLAVRWYGNVAPYIRHLRRHRSSSFPLRQISWVWSISSVLTLRRSALQFEQDLLAYCMFSVASFARAMDIPQSMWREQRTRMICGWPLKLNQTEVDVSLIILIRKHSCTHVFPPRPIPTDAIPRPARQRPFCSSSLGGQLDSSREVRSISASRSLSSR